MSHKMSSKIPVRDTKPTVIFHDENPTVDRSRKDKQRMSTYSANFNSYQGMLKERSKSCEMKMSEKNKELRYWMNIKDNQIQELISKVTKLIEENDKLRNEKVMLMDNYSSLMEKVDTSRNDNRDVASEELIKENEELKNDLKMLKILVFRLNKHLDYYQEILCEKESLRPPSTYSNEKEITASWTVNSHLLAPLMNSYEERIREKNDIIRSYETELNQFTTKLRKIIEENEKIHEMYETLYRNSEIWMTEKQRLTSQCEILKNKASIHAKRADLAKEKLVEVLKAYEQKIQSLNLDIDRLQEAYNRSKGEITTLKNFQKNPEAVTQSVKECQKLLEELKVQFEVEKAHLIDDKNNLNVQLNQHREKTNELENLLEKQKLCNEALIEKNKMLKKTLQQERQSRETCQRDADTYREYGNESYHNLNELRNLVQEKEIQIHNMKYTHLRETEELRLKLQKRDETLKKVLEAKISKSTKL